MSGRHLPPLWATWLAVSDAPRPRPRQTIAVVTGDPEPNIIASPNTGAHTLTVNFSPAASKFYNGETLSSSTFTWDFGDGSATVSTQSPSHSYTVAGTFTVRLTIKDSQGRSGTTTTTITVT